MQIETMKEFLILAHTLNYREASERLYISQPTLTRHIQELEDEFGVRLFERSTTAVNLTPEGARIVERVRTICGLYDGILQEFGKDTVSEIIVGVPLRYPVYRDIVRRTIEDVSVTHPGLTCRIIDGGISPNPAEMLDRGCDVMLCFAHEYWEKAFENVPLCKRRLNLWVSEDNPLARRESVSIEELEDMVFRPCTSDMRYIWRELASGIFHASGIVPIVGAEADALYQLGPRDFALIWGGAPDDCLGYRVAQVPLKERLYETVTAVYRRESASQITLEFVESLRKVARQYDEEEPDKNTSA